MDGILKGASSPAQSTRYAGLTLSQQWVSVLSSLGALRGVIYQSPEAGARFTDEELHLSG